MIPVVIHVYYNFYHLKLIPDLQRYPDSDHLDCKSRWLEWLQNAVKIWGFRLWPPSRYLQTVLLFSPGQFLRGGYYLANLHFFQWRVNHVANLSRFFPLRMCLLFAIVEVASNDKQFFFLIVTCQLIKRFFQKTLLKLLPKDFI